ncbi:hypothetical protein [Actinomycetospora sp.]|jgi:hypothetical protein|uniref:hypothetical protein n=1 Tax=Actinomycetospora sp. TaxID=1872135 RepID=UPI002F3E2FB5
MAGRDEVTALFAQALDGDEHAELELGRRWLDDGDTTAGRAAHALAAAALAELERDPVYCAWTDGSPLSGRVAAWARREAAAVPATGLTRGRHRRT